MERDRMRKARAEGLVTFDWNAWAKTERGRECLAKKRAMRSGADPEDAEYAATVLLNDPCAYCGQPATSIDHIEPVVHGGSGAAENLTAACRSCNCSKWARPLLRFLLDG